MVVSFTYGVRMGDNECQLLKSICPVDMAKWIIDGLILLIIIILIGKYVITKQKASSSCKMIIDYFV